MVTPVPPVPHRAGAGERPPSHRMQDGPWAWPTGPPVLTENMSDSWLARHATHMANIVQRTQTWKSQNQNGWVIWGGPGDAKSGVRWSCRYCRAGRGRARQVTSDLAWRFALLAGRLVVWAGNSCKTHTTQFTLISLFFAFFVFLGFLHPKNCFCCSNPVPE